MRCRCVSTVLTLKCRKYSGRICHLNNAIESPDRAVGHQSNQPEKMAPSQERLSDRDGPDAITTKSTPLKIDVFEIVTHRMEIRPVCETRKIVSRGDFNACQLIATGKNGVCLSWRRVCHRRPRTMRHRPHHGQTVSPSCDLQVVMLTSVLK